MTINLTTGFKEGLNRDAVAMAKGIYKLPAFVPQFAHGRDAYPRREGELHGPGTATSDQIPAMLSNKEAVLNAGAVEHVKDKFGDNVIKQWNAEHAPEGAKTKVRGGVLRAAEGFDPFKKPPYPGPFAGPFTPSVNTPSATPVESVKAPGTSLIPVGDRTGSRYTRVGANDFGVASDVPKAAPKPGFTVEPSTNPAGTMQANKALVPFTADPWTAGEQASTMGSKLRNLAASGTQAVKGVAKGLARAAATPEVLIPAAYDVNKALLAKGLQSGQPGYAEAARTVLTGAADLPARVAEHFAGPIGEGPVTKAFGSAVEALTPVPETVTAQRGVRRAATDTTRSPATKTSKDAPVDQTKAIIEGTPSDPNIYGPGGKNYGPNPTAEQVKELFGSTEEGAQKAPDATEEYKRFLQAQGEFNDRERSKQAIDFANYGQVFPGTNPAGKFIEAYTPQQLALDQKKLAIDEAKSNRPVAPEYAAAGNSVIQKSGPGAAEFNQQAIANAKRKQAMQAATWGTFLDPKVSEEDKALATQYLQVLDPEGLTKYLQDKQF